MVITQPNHHHFTFPTGLAPDVDPNLARKLSQSGEGLSLSSVGAVSDLGRAHSAAVTAIASDADRFVCGSADNNVSVWSFKTMKVIVRHA